METAARLTNDTHSTLLSATTSHLFRLPGELRKDIYRLAIVSPDLVLVDSTGVPEPALLSVSKHVRSEAITIDYKENTFNIDIIDFNSAVCVRMSQKKRQLRYRHQNLPALLLFLATKQLQTEPGKSSPVAPTLSRGMR